MRVEKDFAELCESLNASGTEYLIVGGFALGHHGAPRYTQDMDFLVNPARDNFPRLRAGLRAFAGVELPPDMLLQNKIASGRDKDKVDVKSLRRRAPGGRA